LWTSMRRRRATVATPGEWQCKIRTGGVRRLAVANGPNIFQMLLVIIIITMCAAFMRIKIFIYRTVCVSGCYSSSDHHVPRSVYRERTSLACMAFNPVHVRRTALWPIYRGISRFYDPDPAYTTNFRATRNVAAEWLSNSLNADCSRCNGGVTHLQHWGTDERRSN